MNSTTYYLSTNCFVCRAQGYWIILDMMEDKYLCVAHDDLTSVGDLLHGWKVGRSDKRFGNQPDQNAATLIHTLTSRGIITSIPEHGKPFAESDFTTARYSIDTFDFGSAKTSPRCVTRFFLACGRMDWYLRRTALSRALTGVARRRGASAAAIYDADRLVRLVAAFKMLRPFYPRRYLCLFDSLALFEFLASYRVFPQVIFGVIADPFQAHCWLQFGSTVLNDDLERVGQFKPILCL